MSDILIGDVSRTPKYVTEKETVMTETFKITVEGRNVLDTGLKEKLILGPVQSVGKRTSYLRKVIETPYSCQ